MYEICWHTECSCQQHHTNNAKKKKADSVTAAAVQSFFLEILPLLLPCYSCRKSYREFIQKLGHLPTSSRIERLQWVYRLKNCVNEKLQQPTNSLTFACFKSRMECWTTTCSTFEVCDVISVFCYHVHNPSKGVTRRQKQVALQKLFLLLPTLLEGLPAGKRSLSFAIKEVVATQGLPSLTASRTTLLAFVIKWQMRMMGTVDVPKDQLHKAAVRKEKRLKHCEATKK